MAALSDENLLLHEVYAHKILGQQPNVVQYLSLWVKDDYKIIQNTVMVRAYKLPSLKH